MSLQGQQLAQWLSGLEGGHVHPSLDLCHSVSEGVRGVVATANISAGEPIVIAPEVAVLTLSNKPHDSLHPSSIAALQVVQQSQVPLGTLHSLALLLMAEAAQADKSPYFAYLSTLPDSGGSLLEWSDEEMQELKGTALEDASGQSLEAVFSDQVQPLITEHPKIWPAGSCSSFASFKRFCSLVQSRAYQRTGEGEVTGASQTARELYLLPAIDMANHATDPARRNATLQSQGGGDGQPLTFTLRAERDIAQGEQVLHTYGDLSDGQLLQSYGFVDSQGAKGQPCTNPHNFALVPWSCVQMVCQQMLAADDAREEAAAQQLYVRQVALLAAAGVLQPAAPEQTQFVATPTRPLPDELLTAVQVMLLTEDEVSELEAERAEAGSEPLSLGLQLLEESDEFAEAVSFCLVQVIDATMQRYPTSVKEDARLLQQNRLSERQRLAIQVRLAEKDVLQLAKKEAVMLLVRLQHAEASLEGEDADMEGDLGLENQQGDEQGDRVADIVGNKRHRGLGMPDEDALASKRRGGYGNEDGEGDDQQIDDEAEAVDDRDLLEDSDDSEKVGYGDVEYDDGIGELHDRGAAHPAPDD